MTRLILLFALFLTGFIIYQQIKKTPKNQLKNLYWKLGCGLLIVAMLLLVLTGRVHWIGALFAALLPILRNALPLILKLLPALSFLRSQRSQSQPSSGKQSEVNTPTLTMVMDHDNQRLHGQVHRGPYAGQALDQLTLEQLQQLLEYCQQEDQEAYQLLVSYLNHRFGSRWQQHQSPSLDEGELSIAEAYETLGLKPGASKKEINHAHRQLIQKFHPDRGGNDYLAAKINRAKDILLKQ